MKTFLIRKEIKLDNELDVLFKNQKSISEVESKLRKMGFKEHDLEEVKPMTHIGDFLTIQYEEKLLPFQVADIKANHDRVLLSHYILENLPSDSSTADYEKSNVRKFLNDDMLKKFPKDLVDKMKTSDVPFKDKILHDKVFLPSHEELGYEDKENYYKPNNGTKCFKLFEKRVSKD